MTSLRPSFVCVSSSGSLATWQEDSACLLFGFSYYNILSFWTATLHQIHYQIFFLPLWCSMAYYAFCFSILQILSFAKRLPSEYHKFPHRYYVGYLYNFGFISIFHSRARIFLLSLSATFFWASIRAEEGKPESGFIMAFTVAVVFYSIACLTDSRIIRSTFTHEIPNFKNPQPGRRNLFIITIASYYFITLMDAMNNQTYLHYLMIFVPLTFCYLVITIYEVHKIRNSSFITYQNTMKHHLTTLDALDTAIICINLDILPPGWHPPYTLIYIPISILLIRVMLNMERRIADPPAVLPL